MCFFPRKFLPLHIKKFCTEQADEIVPVCRNIKFLRADIDSYLYFCSVLHNRRFVQKILFCLFFAEKELFLTQLRAALRASVYGPLQIMFPMVGSLEDIRKAKEYLNLAKEQLKERKQQFDEQIRVGIMIEIPAIALIADLAAEEVDFASIGSNDLTQYLSAADRMNPEVAAYYKSDSTAMLRLLRFVFQEFSKRGKEISVCGEMAGNPETAQLLVGLGARKLSMSSGNIAGVKAKLAECTLQELTALAEKKI